MIRRERQGQQTSSSSWSSCSCSSDDAYSFLLTIDDFVLPPSTFIPPLQPSPTTPPHPVLVVLKYVILARPSAAARIEARINRLLAFAIAVAVARVDRVVLLGLLASVRVVGRQ